MISIILFIHLARRSRGVFMLPPPWGGAGGRAGLTHDEYAACMECWKMTMPRTGNPLNPPKGDLSSVQSLPLGDLGGLPPWVILIFSQLRIAKIDDASALGAGGRGFCSRAIATERHAHPVDSRHSTPTQNQPCTRGRAPEKVKTESNRIQAAKDEKEISALLIYSLILLLRPLGCLP